MDIAKLEQLRFPIGKFKKPATITSTNITNWIQTLQDFPQELLEVTKNLSPRELALIYRPNGWSIKQVVHHCADSHLNSLIRFKLALTEENPTVRPYFEDRWANLVDGQEDDLSSSMIIIKGVHHKLVRLLSPLGEKELQRTFFHPEHQEKYTLAETIGTYAWHSKHHLAHIHQALRLNGQFDE